MSTVWPKRINGVRKTLGEMNDLERRNAYQVLTQFLREQGTAPAVLAVIRQCQTAANELLANGVKPDDRFPGEL